MLNVIIILLICHLLSSTKELRAVNRHSGRKGVELSHAIDTFLKNNVQMLFCAIFFFKNTFSLKMHLFQSIAHTSKG